LLYLSYFIYMQQPNLQPGGFNVMPDVVKNLLIINVLVMLAVPAFQTAFNLDLNKLLGLHLWLAPDFRLYQFITTMFAHGSFTHLLFNMFTLWMFGSVLENLWGPRRFLTFYLLTGIGASALYSLTSYIELYPDIALLNAYLANPSADTLWQLTQNHRFVVSEGIDFDMYNRYRQFSETFAAFNNQPDNQLLLNNISAFLSNYKDYFLNLRVAVGASGAVYGLLMAYGMLFPNQVVYVYFLFPIKIKYLVLILGIVALSMGLSNSPGDNVAHFAHLGGMLFGFLLIKYWQYKGKNRFR